MISKIMLCFQKRNSFLCIYWEKKDLFLICAVIFSLLDMCLLNNWVALSSKYWQYTHELCTCGSGSAFVGFTIWKDYKHTSRIISEGDLYHSECEPWSQNRNGEMLRLEKKSLWEQHLCRESYLVWWCMFWMQWGPKWRMDSIYW